MEQRAYKEKDQKKKEALENILKEKAKTKTIQDILTAIEGEVFIGFVPAENIPKCDLFATYKNGVTLKFSQVAPDGRGDLHLYYIRERGDCGVYSFSVTCDYESTHPVIPPASSLPQEPTIVVAPPLPGETPKEQ